MPGAKRQRSACGEHLKASGMEATIGLTEGSGHHVAEPKPTEGARTDSEQTTIDAHVDGEVLNRQREHWTTTFDGRADRFDADPSEPAREATSLFLADGKSWREAMRCLKPNFHRETG